MSGHKVQLTLCKYLCYKSSITLTSTNKHTVQNMLQEYLSQNKYYYYIHKWIRSSADAMWTFVSQNKYYHFPKINIKFNSFYGNVCHKINITIMSTSVYKFSPCHVNIWVTKQILPLYPQINIKFSSFYGNICHKTNITIISTCEYEVQLILWTHCHKTNTTAISRNKKIKMTRQKHKQLFNTHKKHVHSNNHIQHWFSCGWWYQVIHMSVFII